MFKWVAAFCLLALPSIAFAQGTGCSRVIQNGLTNQNDPVKASGNCSITSALGQAGNGLYPPTGLMSSQGFSRVDVLNGNFGLNLFDNNNSGAFHSFQLGFVGGVPTISVGGQGGATATGINVNINGVTYPFPGSGNGNAMMPTSPVVGTNNLVKGSGSTNLTDSTIYSPLFATPTVSPIGNNLATYVGFSYEQTIAGTADHRRFLMNLGLAANGTAGAGVAEANVVLYTGMDCQLGAGDCWSMNPLITWEPGYNIACGTSACGGYTIEADANNNTGFDAPLRGASGILNATSGGSNKLGYGALIVASPPAANHHNSFRSGLWFYQYCCDTATILDDSDATTFISMAGFHSILFNSWNVFITGAANGGTNVTSGDGAIVLSHNGSDARLTLGDDPNGALRLGSQTTAGNNPFIDFHESGDTHFDARLQVVRANELDVMLNNSGTPVFEFTTSNTISNLNLIAPILATAASTNSGTSGINLSALATSPGASIASQILRFGWYDGASASQNTYLQASTSGVLTLGTTSGTATFQTVNLTASGNATVSGNLTVSGTFSGPSLNATTVNGVAYPSGPLLNQVPVVTNAAGGGTVTYESIPNAALLNPSITIAGHNVALGSSQNIAATDLTAISGGSVVGNPTTGSAAPSITLTPVLGIPGSNSGTLGLAASGAGGKTVTQEYFGTTDYNWIYPNGMGSANTVLMSNGVNNALSWVAGSVTIGSTAVALGATVTTFSGVTLTTPTVTTATWADNQSCNAGQFVVDQSYIYVCTGLGGTSNVRRAALAGF